MKIGLLGAGLCKAKPVFPRRARQACSVRVAAAVLVNYDLGGSGQVRAVPQRLSASDLSFDRPRPTLFQAADYLFYVTATLAISIRHYGFRDGAYAVLALEEGYYGFVHAVGALACPPRWC